MSALRSCFWGCDYLELYILNKSFQPVAVIDQYSSFIWTRRYFDVGDFELYVPADPNLLDHLQTGYYVHREDCECTMIIEHIEIKTDAENGNYFIISGRSAESILSYRIVTAGGFGASTAVELCCWLISIEAKGYNTPYYDREIDVIKDYITFDMSREVVVWNTFRYENLLTAILSICKQYEFSFKFLLTDNNDGFNIQFYRGINRTLEQTENPPVIFSPKFYNLINSQYVLDNSEDKTMAFIAGEGEGDSRSVIWTTKTYDPNHEHDVPKQLDRREMFVDARDLTSKKDDGTQMGTIEYAELLRSRGKEKLFETQTIEGLSGEVDTTLQFVYRRDWDLGDVVSLENEYGMNATARIIEVIEVDDENGYRITPTFTEWEMIDNG